MSDFALTTDINGKPIPRWQERLEGMYTAGVPFGEILSFVRYLLDEQAIDTIITTPDEELLAEMRAKGIDPEQFAAKMRQEFDGVARLVRENEALRAVVEVIQARRAKGAGEEGCAALYCL